MRRSAEGCSLPVVTVNAPNLSKRKKKILESIGCMSGSSFPWTDPVAEDRNKEAALCCSLYKLMQCFNSCAQATQLFS